MGIRIRIRVRIRIRRRIDGDKCAKLKVGLEPPCYLVSSLSARLGLPGPVCTRLTLPTPECPPWDSGRTRKRPRQPLEASARVGQPGHKHGPYSRLPPNMRPHTGSGIRVGVCRLRALKVHWHGRGPGPGWRCRRRRRIPKEMAMGQYRALARHAPHMPAHWHPSRMCKLRPPRPPG